MPNCFPECSSQFYPQIGTTSFTRVQDEKVRTVVKWKEAIMTPFVKLSLSNIMICINLKRRRGKRARVNANSTASSLFDTNSTASSLTEE